MVRSPLLAFVALAFALALACSGDDDAPEATPTLAASATPAATATPEASPTPAVSPTPAPTPTPVRRPEANPFPADLQADSLALLQEIAALRGIEAPAPVDMFLLTRDQARAYYDRDGDDEQVAGPTPTPGPRPLDARQELYELLGLVPEVIEGNSAPTVNDEELDNLIAVITGFYAPQYDAFYMIETINGGIYGALARGTIVHELTHALQYQAADIMRIFGERAGNFDATTALLSAIEGDAVNSEIALLGFSGRSTLRQPLCFQIPASRNQGTPYAIERELDVWYEDGLCFVQAIAAQHPDGIARVFQALPATMEQVLHPDKYLAGEPAVPVTPQPLTQALGGDWRVLAGGVFGEFGLQNILLNGLQGDRERVQEAAAGWGGDAWRLYVAGDARLLHLETVWDMDDDAPQFRDALVASLTDLGFTPQSEGETVMLTKDGMAWSIRLHNEGITVLVANDAAALEVARRALP